MTDEADSHTYGPQCRLAPVPQPQLDAWLDGIPPSNAQFFYSSLMPIDDPLSTTTGEAKALKPPLRPFSREDNNALEKAWLGLSSANGRENHKAAKFSRSPSPSTATANEKTISLVVRSLTARHRLKHSQDVAPTSDTIINVRATLQGVANNIPVCCDQLPIDAAAELSTMFCPLTLTRQAAVNIDEVVQRVMVSLGSIKAAPTTNDTILAPIKIAPRSIGSSAASQYDMPFSQRFETLPKPSALSVGTSHGNQASSSCEDDSVPDQRDSLQSLPSQPTSSTTVLSNSPAVPFSIRPPVVGDGISGKPFLRVSTPNNSLQNSMPIPSFLQTDQLEGLDRLSSAPTALNGNFTRTTSQPHSPSLQSEASECALNKISHIEEEALRTEIQETDRLLDDLRVSAEVAVGISKLHIVDLPSLQMKPIYWSPINDIAVIQRATWFYRDTMLPVDANVANQIESHYRELRPWSDTWAIELRCAIDIGPVGEEKVSQPLWPEPISQRNPRNNLENTAPIPSICSDSFCAAHCYQGAAASEGTLEPHAIPMVDDTVTKVAATAMSGTFAAAAKSFANYHIAFKDSITAFLLKPSLKPSAYYSRRPFSKISKGATVGIPITRGFDRDAWNRIHERGSKEHAKASKQSSQTMARGDAGGGSSVTGCPGCESKKEANKVIDLVLVVHGVGQKLAERVESFHFTHAVNGLRRAMNAELKQPVVQSVLRKGSNGVMVLPVNWRHLLSFEDGGFAKDPDRQDSTVPDNFGLKDIEPNSIPAVRSMISDVMFDIPFYMSHHKPKMIESLTREANRVYRLWCRNNPGFAENGRVHLIGHSLGSAMAIEVLSKQPTCVPPVDLTLSPLKTNFLEFDISNLFLLGSPSAFFLLLEQGALIPRRGRRKPGIDTSDALDNRVVGEAGSFGCLAVDNIYNVLAKEDPIAYLLNGTIDTAYAASLKTAYVPSATVGFFASISHSLRGVVPGAPVAPHPADAPLMLPINPTSIVRLPSQLELDVHDFTREEIAERKAYLLNDNGQIDYFLRSSGGPLEIQYLNMLSAHTSYWTNQDLIRMLCVEIGRRPGKNHTMPAMRAVKSLKKIIPNMAQM